jgi:hypothetical protein
MGELRRRFQVWRKNKAHPRAAIPEELWEAAVGAAGEHGLGQVSRALRLDYRGLKDRMSSCRSDQAVSEPEPAFVRLEANPLFAEARWVVELEEPSGSRMSIRLGAADAAILPELVAAFGRRRR